MFVCKCVCMYVCECMYVCVCMYVRMSVGYSENKYRLRIFLAHPRDCHFAHVQWLPLLTEKLQTPFREIRVVFMIVPVR